MSNKTNWEGIVMVLIVLIGMPCLIALCIYLPLAYGILGYIASLLTFPVGVFIFALVHTLVEKWW